MPQNTTVNRRIVLNARPRGAPSAEDFRTENGPLPKPEAPQVLLRTLYQSLDPHMRGRMSDGPSYAAPVALGDVMVGGTVSRVEVSRHADFKVGERVLGNTAWQDCALCDGKGLTSITCEESHPSRALGVLGMPGFTAYMGLLDSGRPVAAETVIVAAASGAVGSVVGQIAKIQGCTVVGIAGGEDKCRYVVDELGFDFCVDHHADDLPGRLAAACTRGIDVYFENVGDAVLPLLKAKARGPVCGLENPPEAFIGLLQGKNLGKLVFQLAHE